ncbi:Threonine--tRNA ligase 2 [Candidatus Izimaplasma bacterium HR1]|jgi:threonyl-tRNA synthetase|uniref:threonine--tRNA ligase n=1 Tax=Candidatus Izimoplasma sp. HR1 TaxID=1541959 RepID=UPI0004F6E7D1|nr:Threonine--tRNA ligase 2 [Candidatus Izimaplasma bacterium HR1]
MPKNDVLERPVKQDEKIKENEKRKEDIPFHFGDFKIDVERNPFFISFPNGSKKEYFTEKSLFEIAQDISPSLKKRCIVGKVNGNVVDMNTVISSDSEVVFITDADPEALEVLRHSTAHLLAETVKKLYPHAKFGVGPTIEDGFYYDIDLGEDIVSEHDLKNIEKEMKKIASRNAKIERGVLTKEEALDFFKKDEYKVELISELPENEEISIYKQDLFTDLCRGPHVPGTKWVKHFKLLSVAGAYWRGNSDNIQLTRIYGTVFFKKEELDEYLHLLEERKKRDHRKLGKQLDLFMLSEYGPGFPFWLPNGMTLRRELENFWYDVHLREGYKLIQTPIMLNKELWEISGHWGNYRENMYTSSIDDKEFAVKPMNCPGGMLVYKRDIHSYKDFPLKVGELGLVHRHEASGALNGLFRVRNFTQDDAHIFMTEEQIVDEIKDLVKLYDYMYSVFNLEYHIELSTRPEDKYIGEISTWDRSEKALADALDSMGKEYVLNPGDGAFYGPKLDFKLKDSMKRIWQCGTIQLDMNLPERFDLTYIDKNGDKKRPVMLHRALYGSIERFIGILIEHYAGAFPLWLAPVQIKVIPVNLQFHEEFAKKLNENLLDHGVRSEMDIRDEKLGYKIREAQTRKVPYQLVIGDKEVESNNVTYRKYGSQEQVTVSIEDFINMVTKEIKNLGK